MFEFGFKFVFFFGFNPKLVFILIYSFKANSSWIDLFQTQSNKTYFELKQTYFKFTPIVPYLNFTC